MTLSKHWRRLLPEEGAVGQRWYCPVCDARYKTTMGVLCEIGIRGTYYYCRAAHPEHDVQDLKCMAIEQADNGRSKTPQELIDSLGDMHPMDKGDICVPVPGKDATYKIPHDVLAGLPTLDWPQLYNVAGVTPPLTKKQQKAKNWEDWERKMGARPPPPPPPGAPGAAVPSPPPPPGHSKGAVA